MRLRPNGPINFLKKLKSKKYIKICFFQYEQWLQSTQSNTAQYNSAMSGINSARSNMRWGTANADIILAAARDSASSAFVSILLLTIMTVLAMVV